MEQVVFNQDGLIPAIIQDNVTGKVLMLAYMNQVALKKTLATKETWFYSRSRQKLWQKGETSGNRQLVVNVSLDCDRDALLVSVIPQGPACHTGTESCFYQPIHTTEGPKREVIHTIIETIAERRQNPIEGTYTSYLFAEGLDKILKKVGEEAAEVIIGAKNNDKEEITWEIADLIYHTLVLMNLTEVELSDIKSALYERHVEKHNSLGHKFP